LGCGIGVSLIGLEEDGEGAVAEEVGIEYPRSGLNGVLGMGVFTASAVNESTLDDVTDVVEEGSGANGL